MENITLNLPYDLSKEEWEKVDEVFRGLDGWMNHTEYACWYSMESDMKYIAASVEPNLNIVLMPMKLMFLKF